MKQATATIYYNNYSNGAKQQRTIKVNSWTESVNKITYEFLRQTGISEYTHIRYIKSGRRTYEINDIAMHISFNG